MIPTASQVFASARGHLGDTAVPGGQIFKDNFLIDQGHWPLAYDSLCSWLDRNGNKALRKMRFFNLPANISSISATGMGITDMGKPQDVWDRQISATLTATSVVINAASAGVAPSVDLTIASHGLAAGAQVVAFGFGMDTATVTDSVNGMWTIAVPNSNTVRLLGCETEDLGSAATATGVVSTGAQAFNTDPIPRRYELDSAPLTTQASQLTAWTFENGAFKFYPSSSARQIKIAYMISGNTLVGSASVGIDGSLAALSLFTAASAAASKGFAGKARSLFMRAIGNTDGDTTNVRGGAFYELAQIGLQVLTGDRIRQPRYRVKRNVGPYSISGSYGLGY